MLESDRQTTLDDVICRLVRRVRIPEQWANFLEAQGVASTANERRRFARRFVRDEAVCVVDSTLPAIERRTALFHVYLKDLSRGGICFLHEQQLFPCERFVLWTRSGKLAGEVIRCVKHNDLCYEVGAKFAS